MFDEIDYRKEGQNAERFARLYGDHAEGMSESRKNSYPYSLDTFFWPVAY